MVTLGRVRALITSFWIFSLGFAVMTTWKFSKGKSHNYTLILLCILVSLFCYLKILFTLRQNQIGAQQPQGQPTRGGIPFNIARYRKTVNTAIWVEVTLIGCYLPYSIVIAIITIHGSSPFLDAMWGTTVSSLFKFISQPNYLLLEDEGSKTRSKEHDQSDFWFVKLVRLKINE